MAIQFLPINLSVDFETCYRFRCDAFECSFGKNPATWPHEVNKEEYRQWLQKKISTDPFAFMHVWEDEKIIGQLELGPMKSKPEFGYIYFIYLIPEYRGRGLGSALQDQAARYFLQKGYSKVFLSVSPKNSAAKKFYEATGWKDQGPRPNSPEVRYMSKVFFKEDSKLLFYRQANAFLTRVFAECEKHGIDFKFWPIDHLCYRTNDESNYQETVKFVSEFASLLTETMVNGRKIATLKLHQPLWFRGRTIFLLEIPAPKPGKVTKIGFEHFEVVTSDSFIDLSDRFEGLAMVSKGLEKEINQELEIELLSGAVKFHNYSLADVIRLEKAERLSSALQKTQLLAKLKKFKPLVSGTYPLGLQKAESDVDVCCAYENEKDLSSVMEQEFSGFAGYQKVRKEIAGKTTFIFRFQVDQLVFELFFQKGEPQKQRSFRHLQIESRLLALMTTEQIGKLAELKAKGLKTEPAYLEALGFKTDEDPFSLLEIFHSLSETELRWKFQLGL